VCPDLGEQAIQGGLTAGKFQLAVVGEAQADPRAVRGGQNVRRVHSSPSTSTSTEREPRG
jgi:hypothetical protein